MATELELKYALPSEEVSRQILEAESLGAFELRRGKKKCMVDVYMDTEANRVHAHGFAFRIRTSNGKRLACLKSLGSSESALHEREEIEIAIPHDAGRELWPKGELSERLAEMIGEEALEERATILQTRYRRDVIEAGEVFAELTVDEVEMSAGSATHGCFELEVELLSGGRTEQLEAFDRVVKDKFGLEAVHESKFERAMRLAGR